MSQLDIHLFKSSSFYISITRSLFFRRLRVLGMIEFPTSEIGQLEGLGFFASASSFEAGTERLFKALPGL